jgi:hypothetical protein
MVPTSNMKIIASVTLRLYAKSISTLLLDQEAAKDILLKLANVFLIEQHSLETGSLLPQHVGNQNERYLMYSIKCK